MVVSTADRTRLIHAAGGGGGSACMPAALFEEQFTEFFDYDTGERKLRCLSRAAIPQDADEDPALARICTGMVIPQIVGLHSGLRDADVLFSW
jgi:hypothetical protein